MTTLTMVNLPNKNDQTLIPQEILARLKEFRKSIKMTPFSSFIRLTDHNFAFNDLSFSLNDQEPSYPSPPGASRYTASRKHKITKPIIAFKKKIGELTLELNVHEISEGFSSKINALSLDIGRTFTRRYQNLNNGPDKNHWVGISKELSSVEFLLERIAPTPVPILVFGEIGTGKEIVARYIHQLNPTTRTGPFIQHNFRTDSKGAIQNTLYELNKKASNGTLYISGLETLDEQQMNNVDIFLKTIISEPSDAHARLVFSYRLTQDKVPQINHHFGANSLSNIELMEYLSLESVPVQLPRLSERKQDIDLFIEHTLNTLENAPSNIDEAVRKLLCEHNWNDNFKQLERTLTKLAIVHPKQNIDIDAFLSLFPNFALPEHSSKKSGFISPSPSSTPNVLDKKTTLYGDFTALLARGESIDLSGEHPALSLSLDYIGKHYREQFTLADLASIAFVSPSHLSFLLKRHFDLSFKQILIKVRIEKAKLLLVQYMSRQVTQIAIDVGFIDLSNFEKTFKRIVGVTPTSYRKFHRKALSISN